MNEIILQEDEKCAFCEAELPKGSNAFLAEDDQTYCDAKCAEAAHQEHEVRLQNDEFHPERFGN